MKPPRPLPPLWLEQYALGELSAERRLLVEQAYGDELPGRLAALKDHDAEVLAALPPRVFAARLSAPTSRRSPWLLMVPVVLAAMALVWVVPASQPGPTGDPVEITRAKGTAWLQVHRLLPNGRAETLEDGDQAHPGDRLQVSYTAGGAGFGAIGSLDGRGVLTWHLPTDGKQAVALEAGSGVALPSSYQLDDAPDHERFFFITSSTPFGLAPVARALQASDSLKLEPPLSSTVLTLRKENRP